MLDTVRHVQTPEGVALHLPAAGPLPRALAWAMDAAIRIALLLPVAFLAGLLSEFGIGIYLLALFAVFWGYPIAFEQLWNGQTPGKRVMGLRVISADGAPVGLLASVVRNLLRTVDMLPFGYALGIVTGLLDAHGRRIGDMVAGSLVVHVPPPERSAAPVNSTALVALPAPLLPPEQAALLAYAERAREFSPERHQELAAAVPVLSADRYGQIQPQRLLGMAEQVQGQ